MSHTNSAQRVVQALCQIKAEGPPSPHIGLCGNVDRLLTDRQDGDPQYKLDFFEEERHKCFLKWDDPMASGCEVFPIRGSYVGHLKLGPDYMWEEGEYAEARWRLLDYMIEYFNSLYDEEEE